MSNTHSHNSGVYIPCRPECSERSATCHAECGKYKKYLEEKKAEADEKQRRRQAATDMIEYTKNFSRRYMKKSGRKK